VDKESAVGKAQRAGPPPSMLRPGFGRAALRARRPEPPLLMLRQFDFSVEPGQTYRYRARLVVWDTRGRRKEVAGLWSEPTESILVPRTSGEDRLIPDARSIGVFGRLTRGHDVALGRR